MELRPKSFTQFLDELDLELFCSGVRSKVQRLKDFVHLRLFQSILEGADHDAS